MRTSIFLFAVHVFFQKHCLQINVPHNHSCSVFKLLVHILGSATNTVESGYNDIGSDDSLPIESDNPWYPLIPHC
jgi:hypothetical protein